MWNAHSVQISFLFLWNQKQGDNRSAFGFVGYESKGGGSRGMNMSVRTAYMDVLDTKAEREGQEG